MKTKQERRQYILNVAADKLEHARADLAANPPKRSEMTKPQFEKILDDIDMLVTAFREGRVSIRKATNV